MEAEIRQCHDCRRLFDDRASSRCALCRPKRQAADDARRVRSMLEGFPAAQQWRLLGALRRGVPFGKACQAAGIHPQRVNKFADRFPLFGAALDEALIAGRDPKLDHGSASTYRHGCRCPECRHAKRERGEWVRREA